ncbi:protein toll-like [Melitaea cinxia]|uniref:protein toll-like n=1 Tax=Melitaea cinxia TaxID=113334 RepID=UPI001E26F2DB|nr:protein toll-like [Melitaea cinxia]
MSASFHTDGKELVEMEKLKINVITGHRISIREIIMLRLMLSDPTELDLIARMLLLTSHSENWLNKKIYINGNKVVLKLSNKTFSNLPSLNWLLLVNSFIENIPAELFRNNTNLKILSLQENNIKYIPNNIFKGLKLTDLDLSHNKISYLNSDVFSEQTSMTKLKLSYNELKSLPGELFSNMNSLEKLDLGHNSIGFLNKSTFAGLNNLVELSLTENRIEHLNEEIFAPRLPLEGSLLSNINLTNSSEKNFQPLFVSRLFSLTKLKKLRILDLSHNNISVCCEDWTSLDFFELDLSHNYTTSLPPEVSYGNNVKVDLRYNNIQQFKLPIQNLLSRKVTFLIDYNPYRCDCDFYYFTHNYKLGTKTFKIDIENAECAQPPALKGVKLVNFQPEVLTCDVDCKTGGIIKHPMKGSNCNCTIRINPIQQRLEMFCDYLPDVYPKLPPHINSMYLKLRYVTDVPLLPAEVKIVDFSSLNLTEPPIANSVALNLTNNYLTKAPLELLQRNCSVYLSNNPFDCTCWGKDNVLALNAFQNLILDYKNLTCSKGIYVSYIVVEQLCTVRNAIIIGLSLGIIAILFIICTIIAVKYTTELRIMLRELGLWRGDLVGGEVYDAFVSFTYQDEDFVREKLLPKLEKGKPPLKICVHYRDWVIGDYIPAQISRSVDQSRYTIIVLSRNFVESMWGRMEFRTAHAKDRVIILMLEDLSANKSLDPELRAYISMKTYVKADDPLVWERLRDAVLRRRRKTLNQTS